MDSINIPEIDTENPPAIMENDELTETIKEFNFDKDDDFDIVIDTGSDKKD